MKVSINSRTYNSHEAPQKSVKLMTDEEFKTPLRIILLRVGLFSYIIGAAAVLGFLTYKITRGYEVKSFNTQYQSAVNLISDAINRDLQIKLNSGMELATMYGATLNGSWPNVYLPSFEKIASSQLTILQARSVSFCPFVYNSSRKSFEYFTTSMENDITGYDSGTAAWPISRGIYSIAQGTATYDKGNKLAQYPNLLVPIWQIGPFAENLEDIMFDSYSDSTRAMALNQVIFSHRPSITSVLQLGQDGLDMRPSSILYFPIIPEAGRSHVLGVTAIVFSWDQIIANILPSYILGIVCVLKTSTAQFTFRIDGRSVVMTALGDQHEQGFDIYQRHIPINMTSIIGNDAGNNYDLYFYPSKTYGKTYFTFLPIQQTLVVVVIIICTSFVFFLYDYLVSAREATLATVARTASGIVDGLFPSFVKGKLFKRHASVSVERKAPLSSPSPTSGLARSSFGVSISPVAKVAPHPQEEQGSGSGGVSGGVGVGVGAAEQSHERHSHAPPALASIGEVTSVIPFDDESMSVRGRTTKSQLGKYMKNGPQSSFCPDLKPYYWLMAYLPCYWAVWGSDDRPASSHFFKGESQQQQIAESFESVTVLFGDIAGFTKWSSGRTPSAVFEFLEALYAEFDKCARTRDVFKVETIGDCYMAVTGIPDFSALHAHRMCLFALDMLDGLNRVKDLKQDCIEGLDDLQVRIGMHSGPVTAGVLRGDKARFQLFGDTVNTASRMESTGSPSAVQLSADAARIVQTCISHVPHDERKLYKLLERGELVEAKGKGAMKTYWLTRTACTTNSTYSCTSHLSVMMKDPNATIAAAEAAAAADLLAAVDDPISDRPCGTDLNV